MRRRVNRIMALHTQREVFAASHPLSRRGKEPTCKVDELPQSPRTKKCKISASDVVFTTKGSRRVLVCKRTRHQAASGTLHHRSRHVGGGVSGGPYAETTVGGRSARMWQDRARLCGSGGGQYGGGAPSVLRGNYRRESHREIR